MQTLSAEELLPFASQTSAWSSGVGVHTLTVRTQPLKHYLTYLTIISVGTRQIYSALVRIQKL